MEYVVGLILAVLAALFFKNKADRAEVERKLAETKAKDQVLKEQQDEIDAQIKTLDAGIEAMRKKKEAEERKRALDNMSLKERADRIKKRLDE